MIPTNSLAEQSMKLLAADATTLAPVTANKIALVKAPFSPSGTTVLSDLVLADFDGSTPKSGVAGTQPEGVDPATGAVIIDISPGAGGWRWETTGLTNLPQTIYGFALIDDGATTYLAGALLATPIVLSAVNQRVDLGALPSLTQANGAIS